jgi:hypothetical protein
VSCHVEEQIGGLDVAVDDTTLMGMVQRLGCLNSQASNRLDILTALVRLFVGKANTGRG